MSSVFILGATGCIGGSVLAALIKRYPDWSFTALVRNEKHFEPLRSLGVTIVQGSFADKSLISDQARLADIVINAADCDDVPLTETILSGMKKRFEQGKPKGILIHTSGTGNFIDGKHEGRFDSEGKVWNDADENDIRNITPSMPHGQVDAPILKAGEEGYVLTYILCLGIVLGSSTGPIKHGTIFLKHVVPVFLREQRAIYIGEGTSEFAFVHIEDVVDYFLRVIDITVSGKDAGASPYARFFIVASHAENWGDIAKTVGIALHKRGLLDDATPKSVPFAEDLHMIIHYSAMNERVAAEKGKALGWSPRTFDLQTGIDESIDDALSDLGVA